METNEKIVIYQTIDGETSIDVRLEGETVWLSQNLRPPLNMEQSNVRA